MATPSRKISRTVEKTEAPAVETPAAAQAVAAPTEAMDAAAGQIADASEMLRRLAETSLEQTRTAYARMKTAAEEATGSIEEACSLASKGVTELNLKTLDALKANTDAAFDLARSLVGVRSLSEAVALQSEHLRKHFDATSAQAKDIASLAQKIAGDATAPISAMVSKGFHLPA